MRSLVNPYLDYWSAPRERNGHNRPGTGPCFIYGNHSSNLDPFLINYNLANEPTAGVMTRYQFYKPVSRILMDSIGTIPTSKYVPEPHVIRGIMQMIEQRRMIVIFPEGGRRWDGRPKSVIEATLKLFWKMRIPVHPVQIHGSYLGWPRWADRPRHNSVELNWTDPLHPSDFSDYETFRETCRDRILFDENHPPVSALPRSVSKPALGIQRLLYRCPYSGEPHTIYTPDGYSVYSRTSPEFAFTMDAESRLVDSRGIRHELTNFYDRINQMPILKTRRAIVISPTRCTLYRLDPGHTLTRLGSALMELMTNQIVIRYGGERHNLPLEDIHYNSVEKNHKLVLTDSRRSFMADLGEHSALQWQLYIRRLQQGETAVTSL